MDALPTQNINNIHLSEYICMNTATPSSTSGTPRRIMWIPSLTTMKAVTHRNRVEKRRRIESIGMKVRGR